MKTIFLVALIAGCVLVTLASPAKDLKEAKKEAARKKLCSKSCDAVQYAPVCGGEQGSKDKPMSFGNTCVLENYNCEKGTKLSVISQGECPGGQGVRLS